MLHLNLQQVPAGTSNHNLPIESGRFNKKPLVDRICPFCYSLGDVQNLKMQ